MITVKFKSSQGYSTPVVSLKSLKPFIGSTRLKKNDTLQVKVVNEAGLIGQFDFVVASKDAAVADGWNSTMFGSPTSNSPISLGICEVKHLNSVVSLLHSAAGNSRSTKVSKTASTKTSRSAGTRYDRPNKTALVKALKRQNGNKTATARDFFVSPRTLGRWLESYGINA